MVSDHRAVYSLAIDWEADGDFDGTYDDVTADTIADGPGLTVSGLGRDQARATAPPQIAELSAVLDNRHARYSTENPASPLDGNILAVNATEFGQPLAEGPIASRPRLSRGAAGPQEAYP